MGLLPRHVVGLCKTGRHVTVMPAVESQHEARRPAIRRRVHGGGDDHTQGSR